MNLTRLQVASLLCILLAAFGPWFYNRNPSFEGIVALPQCSGSVIKLDYSLPTDKALVLTNGHCLWYGFPDPNSFVLDDAAYVDVRIYTGIGYKTINSLVTKAVYSTMTGTDITIYELFESYKNLEERGVRPFTLSRTAPSEGTKIGIVSGYWKTKYACRIEKVVSNLLEGDYEWNDSLRYSRPGCEVIHGTSALPVIEKGTRNVIAINNTGNDNGEVCTNNNPCESNPEKTQHTWPRGYSDAQQTALIYSCVNSERKFDLNIPGCKLFHGNNR